jgi:hypothetical protein
VRNELRMLGFVVRSRQSREEPDVIIVDSSRARGSADGSHRRGITLPLGPNPNPLAIHRALRAAAAAIDGSMDAEPSSR